MREHAEVQRPERDVREVVDRLRTLRAGREVRLRFGERPGAHVRETDVDQRPCLFAREAGLQVLGRGELLQHDRRALILVEEDLQPGGVHALRRAALTPDALQELIHSLGAHVGEPHDPYVHGRTSS